MRSEISIGTVGFNHRDWNGIIYPPNQSSKQQLGLYSQYLSICELPQFTYQMPEPDKTSVFARQNKFNLKFLIRIHQVFTLSGDFRHSLSMVKYFRRGLEPLSDFGQVAGLVAQFPYSFKRNDLHQDYLEQLSGSFRSLNAQMHLDFRHPSWFSSGAQKWLSDFGLGLVCVDEPDLPGLVPPINIVTAKDQLIRLHGRNENNWWSGTPSTRYDYLYPESELNRIFEKYTTSSTAERVFFVFQNTWLGQAFKNASYMSHKLKSGETKNLFFEDQDNEQTSNPISTHQIEFNIPDKIST